MAEKIYWIRSIEHHRVVDKTTKRDNGHLDTVCVGEAGLEEFAKTHNIANVERDASGHIVRCTQKEHSMSGGFEGCFFEFIPEEAEVMRPVAVR
jgi:hypothetical protein